MVIHHCREVAETRRLAAIVQDVGFYRQAFFVSHVGGKTLYRDPNIEVILTLGILNQYLPWAF